MKAILAFLLVLLLPVPLAAQHESEWTVVTLARDGSWGVGTSEYYGPALASALRKCEAMSGGQSDCGAEVTAVRQGWTLGILCGDHRVLVAATDLTTAIMDAQARQIVPERPLRRQLAELLVRHVGRSARLCRELPETRGQPPEPPSASERRDAQRTLRASLASRIMVTSDSMAAAKITHSAPAVP